MALANRDPGIGADRVGGLSQVAQHRQRNSVNHGGENGGCSEGGLARSVKHRGAFSTNADHAHL